MFVDEIRRAIEAAPRMKLPDVAALLWRAYGAGQVTEAEAEALSNLIEEKASAAIIARPKRPIGSRPRSPESLERRRRWAASGRLPPRLACQFTLAEHAVLATIAAEIVRKGSCQLTVGHIAALAGVSQSTVRNALREARRLQLLTVEERRVSARRSDTNIVRIISPEWMSWLRLARKGGGCKSVQPTTTATSLASKRLSEPSKRCRRAGSDSGRERPGKRPHATSATITTTSTSSTR